MSVVACMRGRVVVVEAEREHDGGGEHGTGHGDAVAQHGLVRVAALQPGRRRQQRGGGAEQRQRRRRR